MQIRRDRCVSLLNDVMKSVNSPITTTRLRKLTNTLSLTYCGGITPEERDIVLRCLFMLYWDKLE